MLRQSEPTVRTTLKAALQLSNQTNNQHIKPLVLALLSCYFKHTEIDQAQKMLHSSREFCCLDNKQRLC